jgi:hypothetical protein
MPKKLAARDLMVQVVGIPADWRLQMALGRDAWTSLPEVFFNDCAAMHLCIPDPLLPL